PPLDESFDGDPTDGQGRPAAPADGDDAADAGASSSSVAGSSRATAGAGRDATRETVEGADAGDAATGSAPETPPPGDSRGASSSSTRPTSTTTAPTTSTAPTITAPASTGARPTTTTTDDEPASSVPGSDGNRPPALASPTDRVTPWGQGVVLAVRAEDPDDDSLRYEATNLPPGLRIDDGTGVITGVPAEAGTWAVEVSAGDGRHTVTVGFDWTVTPAPVTDRCALEGEVRSRRSMEPVRFEVVNQSAVEVEVHWLNHSGNRVPRASVAAGATAEIQSFRTHPWVVVDPADGRCIDLLSGIADGDRFTIGEPG
ncbi:MAG: putative Ig domain-containing protein, partial [Actinomycetota bacterium]